MAMPNPLVLQLVASLLLAGNPLAPRSLAEVARAEKARRQALKTTGKRYTNADLARYVARERASIPPAAPAALRGEPEPLGDEPTPPAATQPPPADAEPVKDEAWWRARITEARARLERSRLFLEALQSRVNALTNDFYARDDPAQRAVIEQERNRALAETERVGQDVEEQGRAIAEIEEAARQAGVPPGWLR